MGCHDLVVSKNRYFNNFQMMSNPTRFVVFLESSLSVIIDYYTIDVGGSLRLTKSRFYNLVK